MPCRSRHWSPIKDQLLFTSPPLLCPLAPAMAPLLALILAALPLGEMEGGTDLCGGRAGRAFPMGSSPSSCSALGEVTGLAASLTCGPGLLLPRPWSPAQALDCHVCAYNGENCFNPMRCPAMVTYCMTTRTCE